MPTYTFVCKTCGQNKEIVRPMKDSSLPVFCDKDNTEMFRNLNADFGKQHFGDIWPMVSYAAGVHPDDVPAEQKFDREHGVPTEYRDGDPVFTSPAHRKKYCEAHGLFDRNAGFRDPVPARCR
jgi:hypothetical protein